MKKLYSTPNVIKAVSLGTAMAALLSSVSPVFAANLAIRGSLVESTIGAGVSYAKGSHGSIVLAGDDDFCGVDNVVNRGGQQQANVTSRITAEEQYNRFMDGYNANNGGDPYGTTTQQVIWMSDGNLTQNATYMGTATGGFMNAIPEAYGVYSFATGCGSSAIGNYSTAFGAGATTKAGGAQAFGVSALASGKASIAIGVGSEAKKESTVAIGGLANALGKNSVALGVKAKADKNYGIAIGSEAEAQGSGAIAIGSRDSDRTPTVNPNRKVIAKGENAIAIGTHTFAEAEDSVAIGANAQAHVYDGVAIGGGSVSDREKGDVGYDPFLNGPSTETNMAWKSTAGAFSVGEVGGQKNGRLTRQITGVAAGSQDTDAVNVAQLKAMKDLVAGEWKVSVNDQDSTTVKGRDIVDFSVKNDKDVGQDNLKIEKSTESNKNKIAFTLSDQLKLTSVTTGNSIMSGAGFMFVDNNGPKMTVDGIDAGNKKITRVEQAENDTDAVNLKQLKEMTEGIKGGGWKLSVEDEDAEDVEAGSTVHFSAVENKDGNKNIKIVKDNENDENNVKFDLADNITVKKLTAGRSTISDDGIIFDGSARITTDGIDAGDKIITGVKAGENETDAVNVAQLNKIKEFATKGWKLAVDGNNATDVGAGNTVNLVAGVDQNNNKNITIEKDNKNKVTFILNDDLNLTSVTTGDSIMSSGSFMFANGDGPSLNLEGIDAGNEIITNVKAGEGDNDAVNYKQLKDVKQLATKGWKLSVDGNNATDVGAGSTVDLIASEVDGYKNITIEKDDKNKVTFALNDDLNLTSVTTGDSIMSSGSFMFANGEGPSLNLEGIDAGNEIITNVKAGEDDNDAVNYKQLKDVKQLATKGWKLSVDGNNATDVGAGSTVDLIASEVDGYKNITIEKDDKNKVTFALNDDLKLTSITTGKSTMSNDGFMFMDGGPSITMNGIDAGNKKITGVLKGTDDTDAVNVSQLNEIKDQIADDSLVKWDEEQRLITIGKEKGGEKVDITGSNGARIIAGVKKGELSESSTEAVNGSQINQISGDIAKFFGGGTKFENGAFTKPRYNLTTINENGKVTSKEYNDVGRALSGLDTNIRHVNQHLIYAMKDVASYFGGGAGYDDENEWHAPVFRVIQFKDNGASSKQPYYNVADAFEGVNNSFTNIHNQISNITENSLVKQDGEDGIITVGKATGGDTINIVNRIGQNRTISGVKDGKLSQTSTDAINGSQLFEVAKNTSEYFGGGADVRAGIKPTYLINNKPYNDVGSAFTGVNISIKSLDDKIIEMKENNLVQQDDTSKIITIGAKTTGTEINVAGYGKVARKISGVQAAEKGDEAVNKDQLDKSIKDITKDIEIASAAAVLYDKENGVVNYGRVTLGGDKNNGPVALLNVKNGTIAENSNDAINGSQINQISKDIANYFGGGTEFVNGAFKGPKYTLSVITEDGTVGNANYRNVGSALTGLDANVKSVNSRLTDVANNFNQKIEGFSKDALLWSEDDKAFVALHEKDGEKTKSKLKFLLDGEIAQGSTDAITGNQLYLISNKLASYFGGGAKYENGQWTDPAFKISETNENGETVEKSYNNVADAFGGVNNNMSKINERIDDVINKVDSDALKWNNDKNAYDASRGGKPNKIINVADGKIEKDSKEAVNGGQLWKTNERVTNVENRVTDVEKDVQHISKKVDNISNTIEDIGDIVINIDNKVDNIDNKVNDIAEDAVRYERDENGNKTNKIVLKGGDDSEPVVIDNVADGKIKNGSKEAINGGQLHDYTKEQMKIVLDESKRYTDQRVNNIVIDAIDDAVDKAKQYTDMKFDALRYGIEDARKEAKQAAAIGLAVSNLRYNDMPGKLSVAFGSGLWRSQSAFAFGAGYTSEKGDIRSNLSVTTSGGHWGIGAGFNMTLN
ncbi:Vomp family autotransporter [Bartonella raoultii]|uniref:Vomp family autotransporter n=1 Tax=Bartonella raoultii TaxID=1457020 RepID=A0ABS7I3W1_9HYPH|nr:Vomp family autotransporter [Bartonella raoultii]MBX4335403.1 Vomp family autotransporter [Bartonella raoultii]